MFVAAIKPDSLTAGLSPNNNKRTEVFLAGCKLGASGHPCLDCFNKDLWFQNSYRDFLVNDIVNEIIEIGNPYITIVGGEPLDQYKELIELIDKLSQTWCHIVLITHYTMQQIKKDYTAALLFSNVIIDGTYQKNKRIFDTSNNLGVKHVVGSSNQNFWHKKNGEWKKLDLNSDLKEAYYT